jgi:uncharacterized protein
VNIPVESRPRNTEPDALRGFALLGILMVNIPFMALNSDEGVRGQYVVGAPNSISAFLMAALFMGKFYLLFSFLFGYSSNYIIRNDRSNRGRWLKRCFALIALGILHFTLLWHGDILFLYGIFGLLLIPFFFRTDRTLKIWTRVIYGFFSFVLVVLGALIYISERFFDGGSASGTGPSRLDQVLINGSFVDSIGPRFELWTFGIASGVVLQGGFAFAAFLLGLRASRNQFLSSQTSDAIIKRLVRIGLFVGLPIQGLFAFFTVRNELNQPASEAVFLGATALAFITAPLLSMGYVGLILSVIRTRPQLVEWMKSAGKMSLTVYISQSIFTSLIFGPWGLGLFQKLDMWAVMLTAIGIWLILVYLSKLWLSRFSQGPLEWLVHALTKNRSKN